MTQPTTRTKRTLLYALTLLCSATVLVPPSTAAAMCYCMLRPPMPATSRSAQAGIQLDPSYSPASAVVLVRDGRRTVLTIEAAYEGPAVELSMVVPIPSSIAREDVKTITGTAFRRLDGRTAPRVRHVWPSCRPRRPRMMPSATADGFGSGGGRAESAAPPTPEELGIEIQDEWPVDEYDVTLLGAQESTGLLTFLRQRGLDLPERASNMLRGYIETNHRFVLLRANPGRAQRLGDTMMLSPIQIAFDSDQLVVPVRLGTLNSPGEQELLLYVLSPEGRYVVANRPNVDAPTDLRMRSSARGSFAELYNSITDEVFRRTPGAAITEYAHVVGRHVRRSDVTPFGVSDDHENRRWTVTRLRHRYGTDLRDDLVLQAASSPLRMTRRWRTSTLNTWARAGRAASTCSTWSSTAVARPKPSSVASRVGSRRPSRCGSRATISGPARCCSIAFRCSASSPDPVRRPVGHPPHRRPRPSR
ncbi:MAG: DUF2330 domain-containing protein [Sandaracinus sp.]|nr:DUF2330 domain-containing protein [Sandaracinus sp.]